MGNPYSSGERALYFIGTIEKKSIKEATMREKYYRFSKIFERNMTRYIKRIS